MALWASAEDRQVGTATLGPSGGESLYMMTITRTRRRGARTRIGALVAVVREELDGRLPVEPSSPISAGLPSMSSTPGPQPSAVGAEPVALESAGGERAAVLRDRPGRRDGRSHPGRVRAGELRAGRPLVERRHVVTAVLVGPSRQAITAAVVFDVA